MVDRVPSLIKVKRAYDTAAKSDGQRVLVDHIWPRGVTKAELKLDEWVKQVAPSSRLRKWFAHDPAKWGAFKERYFRELDDNPNAIERLLARCRDGNVSLIYGAKDTRHNNAVALKDYLEHHQR